MPVIPYVGDDDANAAAVEALERARAARGTVSNLLRALAHSPTALDAFVGFSAHVNTESELDARVRELIILRVAQLVDNPYEWYRHVPKALQLGFAAETLENLHDWRSNDGLDLRERAALGAVDDLVDDWQIEDETHASLCAAFAPEGIVELFVTIGWYLLAGTLILGLAVEDGNPPERVVGHAPGPARAPASPDDV
jgi:alkylhydroperoxidase family enzyme